MDSGKNATIPCHKDASRRIRPHSISLPALFFHGACRGGVIGCGAWLKLSKEERIEICWNGGKGTNNLAELMAIWCGLLAAVNLELNDVSIYGDSKLIIDTMNGKASNSSITEHGWYRRARHLWE